MPVCCCLADNILQNQLEGVRVCAVGVVLHVHSEAHFDHRGIPLKDHVKTGLLAVPLLGGFILAVPLFIDVTKVNASKGTLDNGHEFTVADGGGQATIVVQAGHEIHHRVLKASPEGTVKQGLAGPRVAVLKVVGQASIDVAGGDFGVALHGLTTPGEARFFMKKTDPLGVVRA
jgi:hypothetical protein